MCPWGNHTTILMGCNLIHMKWLLSMKISIKFSILEKPVCKQYCKWYLLRDISIYHSEFVKWHLFQQFKRHIVDELIIMRIKEYFSFFTVIGQICSNMKPFYINECETTRTYKTTNHGIKRKWHMEFVFVLAPFDIRKVIINAFRIVDHQLPKM